MKLSKILSIAALTMMLAVSAAEARPHNPPGPRGGPGTDWHNPPGPRGGVGASPYYRGWHYAVWHGRNWYFNPHLRCWLLPDHDGNPPGPRGGPGTNWENPPGPAGGWGASPDRNRCR